jgi:xylulose-5-phosphate/fructose-6-phosphate phosphoketolase
LFDEKGAFRAELAEIAPKGRRRMGMNAHANGGLLLQALKIPNFRDFAVKIEGRGAKDYESTRILGQLLHAVMEANKAQKNFRVFGPDETASNRLGDVITGTGKEWMAATLPVDENLSQTGRVMEVLSEHMCQGWLEGYLLTGRHGFFSCYEAFIHIIDSMANQHAKWLKVTREIPWRKPIASLNYLLSSLVWRQDHNGFSHQDPGFIDHLLNKKADVVRIYLPPDANTLLSVADHCLRSKNYINLIVAGKQPAPQWLTIDEAVAHCTTGLGVWKWASNDEGKPDVVVGCSGDVPTLEALAAVELLRGLAPDLRVRVVNVVDLMALQPASEHPHGLPDEEYDLIFPPKTPTVFAFHGYPAVIHRLTYRRHNHENLHVRGYKEEGTTTTPFDMCVLNNIDRFQLALDAIRRVPRMAAQVDAAEQWYSEAIQRHRLYVSENGDDLPEIKNWRWS